MDFNQSPFLAPRLTLRVGVTGHRPNKLKDADLGLLHRQAKTVLTFLAGQAQHLQDENDKAETASFQSGVSPVLRFATALAAGADSFTADAAIESGYDLNLILPFPEQTYKDSQGFSDTELRTFDRLMNHDPAITSRTELDVTANKSDPGAYVAAGRLILAHCDILLAVWDGQEGDGAGGTAEILAEAQQRGLIVVWLSTNGSLQLWSPSESDQNPGNAGWFPVDLDRQDDPGTRELGKQVVARFRFPDVSGAVAKPRNHADLSALGCLDAFHKEKTREKSFASAFNILQWVFRRKPGFSLSVSYAASADYAGPHWDCVGKTAHEIGGDGFRDRLQSKLRARWETADNVANHYAHRFRSAYVLNFLLAALAVLLGLLILPAGIWLPTDKALHAKSVLVVLELLCIGYILVNTYLGRLHGWHQKWLDYRSLAEALRPARLPILMGSSPLRPGSVGTSTPGEAWVAWYVRSSLREIGPPTARIGPEQLRGVIDVAIDCEIKAQIAYHEDNFKKLEKLDHRMEKTALCLLYLTLFAGIVFLCGWGYYLFDSDAKLAKDLLKPWTTFFGGALPVFGAALFGMRATGDFRSAARQSRRMVKDLQWLEQQLSRQRDAPDRHALRRTLAQITRTMADDMNVWGLIYSERGLEAGF